MRRNTCRAFICALFFVAIALSGLAWAGEVTNRNGKYDGEYEASVYNKTEKQDLGTMKIELEKNFVTVDFPELGKKKMRMDEIFDRHYVLEITCRLNEDGHRATYVLKIDT